MGLPSSARAIQPDAPGGGGTMPPPPPRQKCSVAGALTERAQPVLVGFILNIDADLAKEIADFHFAQIIAVTDPLLDVGNLCAVNGERLERDWHSHGDFLDVL